MSGIENTYCRAPFAQLINKTPGFFWYSNRNIDPRFYVPGSPDGYIAPDIMPGIHRHSIDIGWQVANRGLDIIGCECKAASSENYASLDLSTWTEDQRKYWLSNFFDYNRPYFIITWVYGSKHPEGSILKRYSNLFVIPPTAWLEMEVRAQNRKTISLTPELERAEKWRSLTLLPAWEPYRLIPAGSTYRIPESHPIYPLLIGRTP